MLRSITLAAALVLAASAANAGHYTSKMCHGKTLRGKAVDFVCAIDQKCRFDKLRGKGTCVSAKSRGLLDIKLFSRKDRAR